MYLSVHVVTFVCVCVCGSVRFLIFGMNSFMPFHLPESGCLKEIALMPAGVYLKGCGGILKNNMPMCSLSPCHFKISPKEKAVERNGLQVLDRHKTRKKNDMLLTPGSSTYIDVVDWSTHDKVVAEFSSKSSCEEDEEPAHQSDKGNGVETLLKAWILAQLDAITSKAGVEVNSLILGNETLLHFEVKGNQSGIKGKDQESSNDILANNNMNPEVPVEILYVLTISKESQRGGNAYELVFDERNKDNNNTLESLEKHMGEPVSFYSVRERMYDKNITSDISSLSWMGTTASEVLNSRYLYFFVKLFPPQLLRPVSLTYK